MLMMITATQKVTLIKAMECSLRTAWDNVETIAGKTRKTVAFYGSRYDDQNEGCFLAGLGDGDHDPHALRIKGQSFPEQFEVGFKTSKAQLKKGSLSPHLSGVNKAGMNCFLLKGDNNGRWAWMEETLPCSSVVDYKQPFYLLEGETQGIDPQTQIPTITASYELNPYWRNFIFDKEEYVKALVESEIEKKLVEHQRSLSHTERKLLKDFNLSDAEYGTRNEPLLLNSWASENALSNLKKMLQRRSIDQRKIIFYDYLKRAYRSHIKNILLTPEWAWMGHFAGIINEAHFGSKVSLVVSPESMRLDQLNVNCQLHEEVSNMLMFLSALSQRVMR